METGMNRRLARLTRGTPATSLLVALDHGLTSGPPAGFASFAAARAWIDHPALDGVVMHKGALRAFTRAGMALSKPVILQSNGMSVHADNPSDKPILVEIEDALRLGADAISIEFAAEPRSFGDNLRALSAQIEAAHRLGMPVMVMLGITDAPRESEAWVLRHRAVSRTLIELGASIIKLRQPPHVADWQQIFDGLREDVQFVMAGGATDSPGVVLARIQAGMEAGAGGVCIGRNIFQHPRPAQFISEIATAMRARATPAAAPLTQADDMLEASL